MCWLCFLTFFFCYSNQVMSQTENNNSSYRLVFWNVENFFDTSDDPVKDDDAFTPRGENHWTKRRYEQKLNALYRVVAATGQREDDRFEMPLIVALAEVENDRVLVDLTLGTPLRQYQYGFIHYESPDARGIDNALLYRKELFSPTHSEAINVSDSNIDLSTRDLLLVEGTLPNGDTLTVIVCHFPSKRGGAAADIKREHVAARLGDILEGIHHEHPERAVVVVGDFNAGPDEPVIANTLMKSGTSHYVNLMAKMDHGEGSHNYQGEWAFLDQIIVSENMMGGGSSIQVAGGKAKVLMPEFMMIDDEKNLGKKPLRTYQATKYLGGYSDHLPVYIDLVSGVNGS